MGVKCVEVVPDGCADGEVPMFDAGHVQSAIAEILEQEG